jgi:hypothetical protein
MVYDNTKFNAAFDQWLSSDCVTRGKGEHYAAELLADFNEFAQGNGLMKRSPGRVVFGRRLGQEGFEKRKLAGLTYWMGLKLTTEREVNPIEWAQEKTRARFRAAHLQQVEAAKTVDPEHQYKTKKQRDEARRVELEEEERRLLELEDAKPGDGDGTSA